MESISARILIRKLAFLKLLSEGSEGVGAATMHSLLDDPDYLASLGNVENLKPLLKPTSLIKSWVMLAACV